MLKSTTQQSPIPVRSPFKSEPLFLTWGGLEPLPPKDFMDSLDFLLYACIRQTEREEVPPFRLEPTLIYIEEGNACTDKFKNGKPYPPVRQILANTTLEFATWVRIKPDSCNAEICKPHNDSEYCRLLMREEDAISLNADRYLDYYEQVKSIFGSWYHKHELQSPDCTELSSERAELLRNDPRLFEVLEVLSEVLLDSDARYGSLSKAFVEADKRLRGKGAFKKKQQPEDAHGSVEKRIRRGFDAETIPYPNRNKYGLSMNEAVDMLRAILEGWRHDTGMDDAAQEWLENRDRNRDTLDS